MQLRSFIHAISLSCDLWLYQVSSFRSNSLSAIDRPSKVLTRMSSTVPMATKGVLTFPQDCLAEDHYGGVTLRLDHLFSGEGDTNVFSDEFFLANIIVNHFEVLFQAQMEQWRAEEKKGIWVHLPIEASNLVPILAKEKFSFHMVVGSTLVMTRWLPSDTKSRLPRGPTHQVGVGCLIYHPSDPNKILVVQEKTGPAAAYNLWKMPTGLSNPDEDIHVAAIRELLEETGLRSSFDGLVCLRQAPMPKTTEGSIDRKFANSRKAADLFFVCRLSLVDRPQSGGDKDEDWETLFKACPDEIAGIQWMNITDFTNQGLWQNSPLYQQLNTVVFEGTEDSFWMDSTLRIRQDKSAKNTLYHSCQYSSTAPSATL